MPNLTTLLTRIGAALPLTDEPTPWLPGDMVTWTLPGNLAPIGIVSGQITANGTPLILHNIGSGARAEDILFAYPITAYPITGHFRIGVEAEAKLRVPGS